MAPPRRHAPAPLGVRRRARGPCIVNVQRAPDSSLVFSVSLVLACLCLEFVSGGGPTGVPAGPPPVARSSNNASEVLPGLFIGDVSVARDFDWRR